MRANHSTTSLRVGVLALAVGLNCGRAASAQESNNPDASAKLEEVVVVGIRASLEKAQEIKRAADQIVDSVVADDIGKLPDANVAEALQRITGVQISRNRGEGDQVQIRGLTETQTLLNGQSIFTAGKERGLSFQDVPAELLAGADVYKTPVANQIEGGLAGVIDLRTRKPFDFSEHKIAATLKTTYADLSEDSNPEGSLLLSNRWQLASGGEFGALLSVAKQKRNYRADTQELSPPAQLADGSGLYAPSGVWLSYELGSRDRTGVTTSFQYRPNNDSEYFLNVNHTRLETRTDTFGFYGTSYWANWNPATNSGALWPVAGTVVADGGELQRGSFWGAQMSSSAFVADNDTRTTQATLGGKWQLERWRFSADASYTTSDFERMYQEARLGAWTLNGQFTLDATTETPSYFPVLATSGDLTSPTQYYADKALLFRQVNDGTEATARFDLERELQSGVLSAVRAGVRIADRKADSAEVSTIDAIWSATATSNISGLAQGVAASVGTVPFDNLLHYGGSGEFPRSWLAVTDLNFLRDPAAFRGALGLTVPAFDDPQRFELRETTTAAYAIIDFDGEVATLPWRGNFGLRYVRVEDERRFTDVTSGTATARRLDDSTDYVLPSLNLRLDVTESLVARLAASKVMTLPNFDQLTPSLSINANDRTGYLGNPALEALTARQLDASLEYYMSSSNLIYGAAFYKEVDGFIQTGTMPLLYGGTTYNVATPSNGEDGTVKGLEMGVQAFLSNLPGWLGGFGIQANYTLVDSDAPGVIEGQRTQLQGLSRNSYNIVGIYDYRAVSLRLAYNYRGRFLSTVANYYPDNGTRIAQTPVYMRGYGMLDAYAGYAISDSFKLAFEVNNITRTVRRSEFGVNGQPGGSYADDRRYALSLHLDF